MGNLRDSIMSHYGRLLDNVLGEGSLKTPLEWYEKNSSKDLDINNLPSEKKILMQLPKHLVPQSWEQLGIIAQESEGLRGKAIKITAPPAGLPLEVANIWVGAVIPFSDYSRFPRSVFVTPKLEDWGMGSVDAQDRCYIVYHSVALYALGTKDSALLRKYKEDNPDWQKHQELMFNSSCCEVVEMEG